MFLIPLFIPYANLSLIYYRHEEAKVRKAYFRMAQKYHPDKNPEGRDMFEKANKAYEFLCSRNASKDGPDPNNIVLVLKAQSILFTRYRDSTSEMPHNSLYHLLSLNAVLMVACL